MDYQPIQNHGVIGNLDTVALVGNKGCIDFMCFPFFDSPTLFAALLDKEKGGYFDISPEMEKGRTLQMYLPDTNVLLTRFLSKEGVGELTDFMPVKEKFKADMLVRRVTNVRKKIKYKMHCCPRFDYARNEHKVKKNGKEIIFECRKSNLTFRLKSTVHLEINKKDAYAEFTLDEGETADFIFELYEEGESQESGDNFVEKCLENTVNYWKNWVSTTAYEGRWREVVYRSALLLKLLISHKYGSSVASPTFGLPEKIGGKRNWDYRYTWIRDSAFIMYVLIKMGMPREANGFIKWVEDQCKDIGDKGSLHLIYRLDGGKVPEEENLDHFEGYEKTSPVRIGNNADKQLQLDIYGELMDAVYLHNKYGSPVSHQFWENIVQQINWVRENWDRKDDGIWEVRGGAKHFLYSRLMCWVALDRAIKLAEDRSFPYPVEWKKERNKIYESIYKDFWNEDKKTFVQYKGADNVDAAILLMPIVRIISPKDPMWLSTLETIENDLISDTLVYRYRPEEAAPDGMESKENTFSVCTFWYIECLSKAGQTQKARLIFEKMMGYANHLGLFSEQLSFQGDHLGNFPQAFTHLGLISAALHLDRQLQLEKEHKETLFSFEEEISI